MLERRAVWYNFFLPWWIFRINLFIIQDEKIVEVVEEKVANGDTKPVVEENGEVKEEVKEVVKEEVKEEPKEEAKEETKEEVSLITPEIYKCVSSFQVLLFCITLFDFVAFITLLPKLTSKVINLRNLYLFSFLKLNC